MDRVGDGMCHRETMSRIRTPTTLPALERLLPDFTGLPGRAPQTHELHAALSDIAQRLRGETAKPFYSTRAVAKFFRVPQTTVVRVYRELETEGVLVRVRATHTLLQPGTVQPRHAVRGVVGIPVWQFAYCTWTEWRMFFNHLEESLRRHHWVADLIFLNNHDLHQQNFTERLIEHELDCVLWFLPLRDYRSSLHAIADRGVHIVCVTNLSEAFPFPSYQVSKRRATGQIFRAWKRAGIDRARFILAPGRSPDPWVRDELTTAGLLLEPAVTDFAALTTPQPAAHTVGHILSDWVTIYQLCTSRREIVPQILKHHRCLITQRLDLPPADLTGCHAEITMVNWQKLAQQIAADIASGRTRQLGAPPVHEAEAGLRAHLTRFAQIL